MTKILKYNHSTIRKALAQLAPGSAHMAAQPPALEEIYAPDIHSGALDPRRSLVVGNRGVGKSFWSSVLADESTRRHVVPAYPRLKLDHLKVILGFHEAAGKLDDAAPSPAVLRSLLGTGRDPEDIWRAVLLRSLRLARNEKPTEPLQETVESIGSNVEAFEATLREFDINIANDGGTFLLLFDALDRLGRDWDSIRKLTIGLLKLALDVRGYRAIRVKIFMRSDQANDDTVFRFADASKLRAEKVDLAWRRRDLYGLLFQRLWNDDGSRQGFYDLTLSLGERTNSQAFPVDLKNDEDKQAEVFYAIAGEFMGADRRRGRTYSWLHDHLADAFGETSPRSFLIALQRAAIHDPRPRSSAIDYMGIRFGVQEASDVRLSELKEDYLWIVDAINALEGLEVPCDPNAFVQRWKARRTIRQMQSQMRSQSSLGPVELENPTQFPESTLLLSLKNIGVIEFRAEDRINMPDIFRVAAKIKRRGGVRPPSPVGRR
jgi:hypothetical protein